MPPVAFKNDRVIFKDHKVCQTCCPSCPDPNGCEGMPHQWACDLHGTPWDGSYVLQLFNCGCALCPGAVCSNGRNLGSGWRYTGDGFRIDLRWFCAPVESLGQTWDVSVYFLNEGILRYCRVRLPGGVNPCSPEGLYDYHLCAPDRPFELCWTTWCSEFWAEVGSVGSLLASAAPLQGSRLGDCKPCRGLA
jgi:hypothetical protein